MLRIIATFILIYLVFRLFTHYILPWVARWYLNRFKKKFYEQNPHLRQEKQSDKKSQSGVKISYRKSDEKSGVDDHIGEYIDFEDIKENKKKGNK